MTKPQGIVSVAAFAACAALAAAVFLPGAGAARSTTAIQGIVDVDTLLGDQSAAAAGTGIVLTSNGEILTNNHVIRDATKVKVTDLDNNRTYTGKVLGYSVTKDVAVIKLQNASGLPVAPLGNSSSARVGDPVQTYGNAQGAGGAPGASGKIVGLGKKVTATADNGTAETLTGMIETDSPLQPGDSGGPMVNAAGQVIGMDTAAGSDFRLGAASSRGFAIPIARAEAIASQIVAGQASSTVHIGPTPFLGLSVGPGSGFFGEQQGSPLTVQGVLPDSPSSRAGLVPSDVITTFGSTTITTQARLTSLILTKAPGDSVQIGWVDQFGQKHTATVTLASGPPQ